MARMQNNGQSCIASKRFIVVESISEQFLEKFKKNVEAMIVGDPMDEKTQIGPVISAKSRDEIKRQVEESVKLGAEIVTGGRIIGDKGYFYAPTILRNVTPGMPAYNEEIFGPVASVIIVKDTEEAIRVANGLDYGLGASLWTNPNVPKNCGQDRIRRSVHKWHGR